MCLEGILILLIAIYSDYFVLLYYCNENKVDILKAPSSYEKDSVVQCYACSVLLSEQMSSGRCPAGSSR